MPNVDNILCFSEGLYIDRELFSLFKHELHEHLYKERNAAFGETMALKIRLQQIFLCYIIITLKEN